jgi:sRNA-binding protein
MHVPNTADISKRQATETHAVAAVLELLVETWPKCFAIYEKRRRPLKIGIHLDILAALDGAVTPAELSRALRMYTANAVYRSRLRAGAVRIGLDGMPAGEVTAAQATTDKSATTPASSRAAPRITLADLREAAKQRREKAGAVL